MGEHVIKLPDVGEGVAEAELVEWMIETGANVREDEIIASVMTDKATVEIPSPVEGKIIWRGGEPGDVLAVGSPLVRLEVDGAGNVKPGETPAPEPKEKPEEAKAEKAPEPKPEKTAEKPSPKADKPKTNGAAPAPAMPRAEGEKPLASPAVRKRAADAGVDLRRVPGTGPAGRITHEDLDAFFDSGGETASVPGAVLRRNTSVAEVPVRGLRRKIAEKMQAAHERIVPITYVEEVDMTALEDLRAELNKTRKEGRPKLTLLPFLMRAMVKAVGEQPHLNAIYDDEAEVIHQHGGVHIGVAAQTPTGLMVPVVKHAEARDLWDCAAEVARLSEAAKEGKASREELSGSTITITSLGAMGGIVTTPVINHPEVAIVGVNKMQVLPRWNGSEFTPRKIMNLSSSFDHRVIDGWDAAVFVQRIKSLLENPAMIFIES
ncbi:dihydrolipoamide acetyltransferase family protein [Hyphococcus luteus]|uniref:Dihydrolipoamide acetyltransferase component of pyruvate dehydrogenase complex n=1 Tax=Hyphococcus luteus TaxID=2058213 RepID=A0A2S7K9A1_9PROT|nr:dihydrolipoamide acetyltransferase family protein [Marinicaulis flavus]PQA89072.1 branched-chain alpha-keto acid dehydrogenase subunit E2 [Marinicaulis flavus]